MFPQQHSSTALLDILGTDTLGTLLLGGMWLGKLIDAELADVILGGCSLGRLTDWLLGLLREGCSLGRLLDETLLLLPERLGLLLGWLFDNEALGLDESDDGRLREDADGLLDETDDGILGEDDRIEIELLRIRDDPLKDDRDTSPLFTLGISATEGLV